MDSLSKNIEKYAKNMQLYAQICSSNMQNMQKYAKYMQKHAQNMHKYANKYAK